MPRGGFFEEFWRSYARIDAMLPEIDAMLDRMEMLDPVECNGLRCVECDAIDDGRRGWTLRLSIGNELVAFCPDCDRKEFGE
jgi:hypothetical protein